MAVNPFDLTGKVAIVTGGNGGIGLGMARGLAQAGAQLALVGRNQEKTTEAARMLAEETGSQVLPVTADVSQEAECERIAREVLNQYGRIDILFNNAGINIRKPPHELTLDEWREVIDVNLTSAFLLSKAVYPAMKAVGGGKIVNIGSMTSIFGSGFAPAYATSKGGIVQLTKSQALAWASDNIQCNAILPGWFDTELTKKARVEISGLHERVLARIPTGRWASPNDMAGTAVWLASPASDYVTGIAIPVDGGYSAML
ncbi:SDR family NAD(P)-dependent oxidoreductase [Tautonia marina]|uniref:SDR family NAD(P)-dependent oxidoreductase n=1 Tax=Tautonia marina TaxID=2653855 RepID=UPI00126120D1|nr:glucose 1-dehydrogenase [Tautonia marina]